MQEAKAAGPVVRRSDLGEACEYFGTELGGGSLWDKELRAISAARHAGSRLARTS